MKEITSISNPIVQQVKSLKDKTIRQKLGQFIVEGANIIKDLPKDVSVSYFFVEKTKIDLFSEILSKYNEDSIYLVNDKVMNAISDTSTPCGILCVVKHEDKSFDRNGNVVVLDGVSDPGNMGTILRTCVACGIKTVFAINSVDSTSMKVVRSSMGGIFRVNVINSTYEEVLTQLKNYNLLTLDMKGNDLYSIDKIELPFALIVGSEAHGVSEILKEKCRTLLALPMVGDIESLNAAVSLSVALYHLSFANILKN